jgi:hypothetical protein
VQSRLPGGFDNTPFIHISGLSGGLDNMSFIHISGLSGGLESSVVFDIGWCPNR